MALVLPLLYGGIHEKGSVDVVSAVCVQRGIDIYHNPHHECEKQETNRRQIKCLKCN